MARLLVDGTRVEIRLRPVEALLSMRGKLVVPLDAIVDARSVARTEIRPRGVRWPGTSVPGLVTAGTYRNGETEFWMVGRQRDVLVIVCRAGPFARIVLGVDAPIQWADRLQAAARAQPSVSTVNSVPIAEEDRPWRLLLAVTVACFLGMAATSAWARTRMHSGVIAVHVDLSGRPNGYGPVWLPLLILLPLPLIIYGLTRTQPRRGQVAGMVVIAAVAVIHISTVLLVTRLNTG